MMLSFRSRQNELLGFYDNSRFQELLDDPNVSLSVRPLELIIPLDSSALHHVNKGVGYWYALEISEAFYMSDYELLIQHVPERRLTVSLNKNLKVSALLHVLKFDGGNSNEESSSADVIQDQYTLAEKEHFCHEAIKLCQKAGTISVADIQSKFKIGYNFAHRLAKRVREDS